MALMDVKSYIQRLRSVGKAEMDVKSYIQRLQSAGKAAMDVKSYIQPPAEHRQGTIGCK
jgi:hypothetical protein